MTTTEALNDAMYGYACDFLPSWRGKWDTALEAKDWGKIKTLITAAYKHAGYTMPLPELEPWWDTPKTFTARVNIIGKDKQRYITPHLEVDVIADNQDQAKEKLKQQGYEIVRWV